MARVKAYRASMIVPSEVWYGIVIRANSTTIMAQLGAWIGTYRGSFTYGAGDDVKGRIDSYLETFHGDKWISIKDVDRSIAKFHDLLDRGNDLGVLKYLFSDKDQMFGSPEEDVLVGFKGADTLRGRGADDTVVGGQGNDRLFGDDGDDLIRGGSDNDRLYGSSGEDTLRGEAGNDLLRGGSGNDMLDGGPGRDTLRGEAGDDNLQGGGGNDRLFGGSGEDLLNGGSGNDILDGGEGNDELVGGPGADCFVFGLGGGDDTIEDFVVGVDLIKIASGASDFSDLSITSLGPDSRVTFADVLIIVENVAAGDLGPGSFDF